MKRPLSLKLAYGFLLLVMAASLYKYTIDDIGGLSLLCVLALVAVLQFMVEIHHTQPGRSFRVEALGCEDYRLVCTDDPSYTIVAHPQHFTPGEYVMEEAIVVREEQIHNVHLPGGVMTLRMAYHKEQLKRHTPSGAAAIN